MTIAFPGASLGANTFTGPQTLAAGVTINKITITQPATGATLTIPDGVTLNAGAGGALGSAAFISTANPAFTGTVSTTSFQATAAGQIYWNTGAMMSSPANGKITIGSNTHITSADSFLNFQGETAAETAIKRPASTTTMQARLGNDSAFCFWQAKLQTDTNATTGLGAGILAALTNASIVLYDGAGQAYRVPCII